MLRPLHNSSTIFCPLSTAIELCKDLMCSKGAKFFRGAGSFLSLQCSFVRIDF